MGGDHGLEGTVNEHSLATVAPILIFSTIAVTMSLELLSTIWFKFKRRRGLYFYTLLLSTVGVILFTLGLTLKFFAPAPVEVPLLFVSLGWTLASSGQSMILYSRLHLVVVHAQWLRWVLGVIVVHALLTDPLVIVFFCGVSIQTKPPRIL
jgi:hypothetical protein